MSTSSTEDLIFITALAAVVAVYLGFFVHHQVKKAKADKAIRAALAAYRAETITRTELDATVEANRKYAGGAFEDYFFMVEREKADEARSLTEEALDNPKKLAEARRAILTTTLMGSEERETHLHRLALAEADARRGA